MEAAKITVIGARENNLRSVDCSFSRGKLIAITGPSGSGKSSLLIETIHREAQYRLFKAAFAAPGARWAALARPAVDSIEGLSFSVAVSQQVLRSSRATVAALAGAYDWLRALFITAGSPGCARCGAAVSAAGPEEAAAELAAEPHGARITIAASLGSLDAEALIERGSGLLRHGLSRIRVGDEMLRADSSSFAEAALRTAGNQTLDADAIIDVLIVKPGIEGRLRQALDLAWAIGGGIRTTIENGERSRERNYLQQQRCANCGFAQEPLHAIELSYYSPHGWCRSCTGRGEIETAEGGRQLCNACRGARVEAKARNRLLAGRPFAEVFCAPIGEAAVWAAARRCDAAASGISAQRAAERLTDILQTLDSLGLGYLQLNRGLSTISSGELQRVRIAREISVKMAGLLYLLDEPSLGLHPADAGRLLCSLRRLTGQNSSVVIIEHDLDMIQAADEIIELGPGPGSSGGRIVFQGAAALLPGQPTKTGEALRSRQHAFSAAPRERKPNSWLEGKGFAEHNLKHIDVRLPLGCVIGIAGVSGSGKSTLLFDCILPSLRHALAAVNDPQNTDGSGRLSGFDQSTLSGVVDARTFAPVRNPRSIVATACGVHEQLRALFALTSGARMRGQTARHFSFNSRLGACPSCAGLGGRRIGDERLGRIDARCPHCGGSRYRPEVLAARYRGMSIAEVLQLTVDEAHQLLHSTAPVHRVFSVLKEIGLGYLKLNQPTAALSHGERQRLALAGALAGLTDKALAAGLKPLLYAFDEPTAGLHSTETALLVRLFHLLADGGHTVVVIEHDPDFLAACDFLIELGPGAGDEGGQVIAAGTPTALRACAQSAIGKYLG